MYHPPPNNSLPGVSYAVQVDSSGRRHDPEATRVPGAAFEQHTRGFGSRILRRHGWSAGTGLGTARTGIAEPVEAEGQKPFEKAR